MRQPLSRVLRSCDNTLKRALGADPGSERSFPNQEPREVFGQWVEVHPTKLPEPFLVSVSPAMAAELDLDEADQSIARFFSGDTAAAGEEAASLIRPWATPYAVSVFGQPIPSPDPFGGGNAYGDGRALSLGEFVNSRGGRWELQLKGAGTTPFSRGADGRAVLRSSVREFLVSEAMHAMGVPTTRALCLVASGSQYTRRAWYAPDDKGRDHPPDTMVVERCAITCRAAPSFLRVGHLELWSRRAARGVEGGVSELRALLSHAIEREFASEVDAGLDEKGRIFALVSEFVRRQVKLSVAWLRVGYVQGNMNSDNCLLSGRTMDYGPFGFLEAYEPLWSPFTSDPERKFGFERQPFASQVNVMTLARALVPLLERLDDPEGSVAELQRIVKEDYAAELSAQLGEMRRAKLGLAQWDSEAEEGLFPSLAALMAKARADYTLFWRQLSSVTLAEADHIVEVGAAAATGSGSGEAATAEATRSAADALLAHILPAFPEAPSEALAEEWRGWLVGYAKRLVVDARPDGERQAEMRATSPKYIPREWMLAEAYTKAEEGDFSTLHVLETLFASPFEEHSEHEAAYYRRTPTDAKRKAGIAYFS